MLHIHRLRKLIEDAAAYGYAFGTAEAIIEPGEPADETGPTEDTVRTVQDYITTAVTSDEQGEWPLLDARGVAVQILLGARRAMLDMRAIELAAAQLARAQGVSAAELSRAVQLNSRTVATRYRSYGGGHRLRLLKVRQPGYTHVIAAVGCASEEAQQSMWRAIAGTDLLTDQGPAEIGDEPLVVEALNPLGSVVGVKAVSEAEARRLAEAFPRWDGASVSDPLVLPTREMYDND
ncbi:Uncharacterised protein [Mycobacteroides abscessus subsp. massiliense]|uniref:hypothetical protein n=1 Tax=Mycobacteroides abscessus TaxID=36809 RepID=UPI0009A5A9F9|nr:hypothetical protein [Mycobacteroides abscessus]RIS77936.1 hypothetical protein D2E54_15400 [Mycobacteroides abscessus]SLF00825.1 Uncharacterised protein [Mycobacteroides abscessus subsp. massiliense]